MIPENAREMIIELSDIIELETLKFFYNKYKDEVESDIILNLIVSSHLSSLTNLMKGVARDNPIVSANVNKFLEKLIDLISQSHKMEFHQFKRSS